jgi:hypothetical protein
MVIGGCMESGIFHFRYTTKKAIQCHDSLHGFKTQRDTATATIEAKLRIQLSQGEHQTLCQVFIDLKKAYDTLHRGRTLEILIRVGPKLLAIIRKFWSEHTMVARQGGYHGEAFKAEQGVAQGDIPSPTIFNIIVDCVVRAWSWEISNRNHAAIDG